MKKVAVVGAGVIGVSSLLRLIEERKYNQIENSDNGLDYNIKIVWIYDSTIPIFGIGESTTPFLPEILNSSYLRYNIKDKFDATLKYGNKFIGWGNNGKNFIRWFTIDRNGFHFDTEKYSKFFIEYIPKTFNNVRLKDEKVTHIGFDDDGAHINSEIYDLIIDCTGGKSLLNDGEYSNSSLTSVNSLLALRLPPCEDNWGVTITKTTKNGFMFGIPLQTRKTFGYTYNSELTSEEEAFEDFKNIIPEAKEYPHNKFSWTPRFSNYLIHSNGKYIRNGNALGFLDPLESFAGAYYDTVNDKICDYIFGVIGQREEDWVDDMNEWYNIDVIRDWYKNISWMYHFGSNHDSPFWKKMIKQSRDYLNDKDKNPCSLLDEDTNFTDDLPNIIGDNEKLKNRFFNGMLDFGFESEFEFFSEYYNFISWASGTGASYAHKFSSNELLTEFDDEVHGELNFKLK